MDFENASLAQLVEQIFCKYQVAGSLPARGSRIKDVGGHKVRVILLIWNNTATKTKKFEEYGQTPVMAAS